MAFSNVQLFTDTLTKIWQDESIAQRLNQSGSGWICVSSLFFYDCSQHFLRNNNIYYVFWGLISKYWILSKVIWKLVSTILFMGGKPHLWRRSFIQQPPPLFKALQISITINILKVLSKAPPSKVEANCQSGS